MFIFIIAFQLISVALLGLSILFILAVVSFAFWHDYFDNEDRFCRTMLECYVSVIREGLFGTVSYNYLPPAWYFIIDYY